MHQDPPELPANLRRSASPFKPSKLSPPKASNGQQEELLKKLLDQFKAEGNLLDFARQVLGKLSDDHLTILKETLNCNQYGEAQSQKLIEEFKKEKIKMQNNAKQQQSFIANLQNEKDAQEKTIE